MGDIRVTQTGVESLAKAGSVDVRVTEVGVETLAKAGSADVRVTEIGVETLTPNTATSLSRSVNDTIAVAESVTRQAGMQRSVSDAVTVAESAARRADAQLLLAEELVASDAVTVHTSPLQVNVSESVGVSERLPSNEQLAVHETITVTHAVFKAASSVLVNVHETIAVTEALIRSRIDFLRVRVHEDITSVKTSTTTVQHPWGPSLLSVNVSETLSVAEYRARVTAGRRLRVIVGENITTREQRQVGTASPLLYDGGMTPPAPVSIPADYWVVGI